jgi:hypothetical protein
MDNTIYWLLVAPASSIQPSCRLDSPNKHGFGGSQRAVVVRMKHTMQVL